MAGQPQPHHPAVRPDRAAGPEIPADDPRTLRDSDGIFETAARQDLLLHHPFDAFTAVLDLIRQAAIDPNVLAIKQTLYRTGKDSLIVDALIQAARNGKDVTVVVELRARFDEEANLGLADRLQEAGVQVVYGVVGYKTHAKMLLIVRREGRKLRRYVHLGTGNYHSGTARAYTDISLITADADIGNDVHLLFQQLSGLASKMKLKRLLQSPFTLHTGILGRIERETRIAAAGRPARIIAKMNALNEPQVVRALYAASQAGVQIDLIIRGAAPAPGRAGHLGQHPRALDRRSFPGTQPGLLVRQRRRAGDVLRQRRLAERNLLRRVETCFPILDPELAKRVYREVLQNYLDDNLNAWELDADGVYHKRTPAHDEAPHSAQMALMQGL